MASTMAVLALVFFGGVGLFMRDWSLGNRLSLALLGVLLALGLLRWARVRAEAQPGGLRVRNLFLTHTVPWEQIVGVRFPDGDAFAQVDCLDGDRITVMAIQRADGPPAQLEAQRLADVVAAHQRA